MESYFTNLTTYLDVDNIRYLDIPLNKSLSGNILTLYSLNNNIYNFYLVIDQQRYLSDLGDDNLYSLLQLRILNADNKYISIFDDEIADALVDLGVRREYLHQYYYTVPVNYLNYNSKQYLVVDYLPYYKKEDVVMPLLYTTNHLSNNNYNFYSSFGAIPFILDDNNEGPYCVGIGQGYTIGTTSPSINLYSDTYSSSNYVFNNISISNDHLVYGSMASFKMQNIPKLFSGLYGDLSKVNFLDGVSYSVDGLLKFPSDNVFYDHLISVGSNTPTLVKDIIDFYVVNTGSMFGFLNSYSLYYMISLTFNDYDKTRIIDDLRTNQRFRYANRFSPLSGFGGPFFSNYTLAQYGNDILNDSNFKPSMSDNYIEGDYLINSSYIGLNNVADFRMGLAVIPVESIPYSSYDSAIQFANSFNGFLELNFLNVSLLSILLIFLGISLISFIKGLA